VPIVRIDFGNGTVLTRTLHGNILTSVCDADGRVLDALPGIYTEKVYLDRLSQLRLLARHVRRQPPAQRTDALRAYHRRQVEVLEKNELPALFSEPPIAKGKIEGPLEVFLSAAQPAAAALDEEEIAELTAKEDVANWTALAEDTRLNESTRRRQIHELLAETGMVTPDKVTRPIYKDVLHADLDDPYLGLGKALFGTYPFAGEEMRK